LPATIQLCSFSFCYCIQFVNIGTRNQQRGVWWVWVVPWDVSFMFCLQSLPCLLGLLLNYLCLVFCCFLACLLPQVCGNGRCVVTDYTKYPPAFECQCNPGYFNIGNLTAGYCVSSCKFSVMQHFFFAFSQVSNDQPASCCLLGFVQWGSCPIDFNCFLSCILYAFSMIHVSLICLLDKKTLA
jgi:hypothetical protein